ncbi:MAG: glycosyltransferase family 2 protein [Siphonobacter sp.]
MSTSNSNFQTITYPPFSAVVITFNGQRHLAAVLTALQQLTDDIIVVDSFSTDRSVEICQQHNVRLFQRTWPGYSEQKNFGVAQARYDWILSVDDDEVVSPELSTSIKTSFDGSYDAYVLCRKPFFCGKPILHGGWNPDWHIRLYNRKSIHWDPTDVVHEGLTIRPEHQVGKLKGFLNHYTVETPEEFAEKTDRYAKLFASNVRQIGKRPSVLKRYGSPAFRFFREYFLKLGFLDGQYGFFIAKENARYTFLKYKR